MRAVKSVEEKFWRLAPRLDGCWPWLGTRDGNGYGVINHYFKKMAAHRVSWEIHHGPVGMKGMEVCHRCDNPPCVNPEHLFLGTHRDNMQDRNRKGRVVKPDNNGENNGRSKPTESDVIGIRTLRTMGASMYRMAREFGVTPATVRNIVNRRLWKCVP